MLRTSKLTALFLLILIFSSSYSQDKTIDSLEIALQNPKIHDTTKLYSIAMTLNKYYEYDKRAIYLNNLMGKLALKNYNKKFPKELHKKYAMYLGAYNNNLANEYTKSRDVVNALATINKSIALFKTAEAYNEMHHVLVGKAIFFSQINEYEQAISCLFTALKYFERENNPEGISYANLTLARIYSNQKKYDKAIEYNKKTIRYFETKTSLNIEDEYVQSMAYTNIGTAYFSMKNYGKAIEYFDKALSLYKKANNDISVSITYSKIAKVKLEQKKNSEAEQLFKKALTGNLNQLATANAYVGLGDFYYRKKEYSKADSYLSKALSIGKSIKNLQLQEGASELLFKTSSASKNFEKALEMHQFNDKLMDSSKTETAKNLLAQQELKYDFEKKELNYKLANEKKNAQKNNVLIALSAFVLLLLLGGYFYYRNNKQKQAIMVLEKNQIKQKLMVSQMNPHFIYNSIDNIQGLIYNKQDDDAVNYLTKFSKLTRQILENSNENYISLEEEVEMIRNYAAIQQLLYGNKFDFEIGIEDSIDTESLFLPPMLTQPFIENAIKHGVSSKSENGMINIRFYLKEKKLFFEVSDNGTGFDVAKKQNNHKSLAMSITKERLANYTKNKDFILQTENITDNDQNSIGAKVIFEIPYIYEN